MAVPYKEVHLEQVIVIYYIYSYLYITVKDIPVGLFCNPICQVSQTERF